MNKVKIYINRDFIVSVNGKSVRFSKGDNSELPEEKALELARAGYLTVLDDDSAVKIVNKLKTRAKAVK